MSLSTMLESIACCPSSKVLFLHHGFKLLFFYASLFQCNDGAFLLRFVVSWRLYRVSNIDFVHLKKKAGKKEQRKETNC